MQGSHDSGSARSAPRDLDPAALALLQRHGPEIMRTARRYAATPEDAEDAFQRAFEIALTQAPRGIGETELLPWLKTVVKHEAYALHRARERHAPVTADGRTPERTTPATATHEHAESRERGLQGAEALARLKPQEVRALVLKARGLSYREIGEQESWTYTKVNRLLSEGRQAFKRRLAGIQAGAECERMEPLLSLLADGEATPEQLATLRPHLKTCLGCRARLREFRSVPHDVAALAPAVGSGDGGRLRTLIESLLGMAHGKSATIAERAHALTEMATSQKLAAVAASAVAVAGGGAAVEEVASQPALPPPVAVSEPREREEPQVVEDESALEAQPTPAVPVPTETAPPGAPSAPVGDAGGPTELPRPRPADPANEFDPSGAAAQGPAPAGSGAPGASEPSASSPGADAPSASVQGSAPSGGDAGAATGGPLYGSPGAPSPSGSSSSPSGSSEFAP